MNQQFRHRTIVLAGLIGLIVVLVGVAFAWSRLNQSGPGAIAIRYSQALARHDLPAANDLLSTQSRSWALDTPAEQLGADCLNPTVAESIVTKTLATIVLKCDNRSRGPTYVVIQEAGIWKIQNLSVR